MRRPTAKQKALLKKQRVKPALTFYSASKAIEHLFSDFGGHTRDLRQRCEQLIGSRVRIKRKGHRYFRREGVVKGLRIRSEEDVKRIRQRIPHANPHLYAATVALEPDGQIIRIGLSYLQRIDHRPQGRFNWD